MLRKRDWFWIFASFALTWGVDRFTKLEALNFVGVQQYGPLLLSLHFNPGAILGLFSQLPSVLRVVTLSTGGAFLIFTFLVLQYLIPARAMALRIGMALLLGGIIGNVTDRIVWGHVVDFISFRFGDQLTPIFNIADAVQWVGHILVMYSLVRHAELFWPESDTRKTQWINLKFQLKYCFILMSVGLGMGIVSGTLSYTYLRVTLLTLTGENHTILERYLVPFTLSLLAVNGIFIGILFLIGKMISLRVAGPVYAFERYIEDLLKGQIRTFQVRRSDEFQQLNEIGQSLKEHFSALNLEQTERADAPLASEPSVQPPVTEVSALKAPPPPPPPRPTLVPPPPPTASTVSEDTPSPKKQ